MNKRMVFLLAMLFVALVVGCTDDGTNDAFDIDGDSSSAYVDGSTGDDMDDFDVEFDYTALNESETIPSDETDDAYDDYIEHSSFSQTVYVNYSDGSAEVSGDTDDVTVSISGAHVTINSESKQMEYVLSGSSSDGDFKIYSSKKFKLTLNALSLSNPTGAAINIQSKKRVFLCLSDGTENSLTDGTSYTLTDGEDMKACLFSEGQLLFSGTGTLNVTGQYKHGICSDDYIRLRAGVIVNITAAAGNGMKANDGIFVDGGVLNIGVSATASKGLSSDGDIEIKGGRTTVVTTGGGELDDDDVSACAGVKCDGAFNMSGGQLWLKSTGAGGKGLSTDSIINITDGTIRVITTGRQYTYGSLDTSAKGIKCDGDINIAGGSIMVRTSGGEGSEGIESKATVSISGGTVEVSSYDDALNASTSININGGSIYAYSSNNDGIDSNGTLYVSGGTVVSVGTQTPEGGFDCDQNTFTITGGTIVGIGGDNSQPSTNASSQPSVLYSGSATAGVYVALLDGDSQTVVGYKLPNTYNQMSLLISSPSLTKGNSYTFALGGQISGGSAFHGLFTSGVWASATASTSLTLSSMLTTVGSSSGGSQPGDGTQPGGHGGQGGGWH